MAAEITASLRAIDPDDPVKYDFALCHLGMMNACGRPAGSGWAAHSAAAGRGRLTVASRSGVVRRLADRRAASPRLPACGRQPTRRVRAQRDASRRPSASLRVALPVSRNSLCARPVFACSAPLYAKTATPPPIERCKTCYATS
jgi:hypothetical protein